MIVAHWYRTAHIVGDMCGMVEAWMDVAIDDLESSPGAGPPGSYKLLSTVQPREHLLHQRVATPRSGLEKLRNNCRRRQKMPLLV